MIETPLWYKVLWLLGAIIFKLFFRLRIEGKIPGKGGMVLAANHRSYLDPIILAFVTSRRINFMAKEELFRTPIFAYAISRLGAFALKRDGLDKTAYQVALKRLRQGKILALFPEGKRSISGKLNKLKEGSVRIALYCKVPIVPVVITGTEKALPPGKKFVKLAKIKVKVGEPIVAESFAEGKKELIDYTLQVLEKRMIAMGANN